MLSSLSQISYLHAKLVQDQGKSNLKMSPSAIADIASAGPRTIDIHTSKSLLNPIDPAFKSPLDEDFVSYYNENLAVIPATHGITIPEIRANPKKYASPWCRDFSNEPFVKDIKISSDDGHIFTGRLYYPDASSSPFGEGPYPVYINFHGMEVLICRFGIQTTTSC